MKLRMARMRLSVSTGLLILTVAGHSSAATWEVRVGGVTSSLRAAIEQAGRGDTIRVSPGMYHEHGLRVNRPLTIEGIGRPVIDGDGLGTILTIAGRGVSISGLCFVGTGVSFVKDQSAILLDSAQACSVRDNHFVHDFFAIYAAQSQQCVIVGNEIVGDSTALAAAGNGIHLWHCSRMAIDSNVIFGHRDGIYLEFVTGSTIVANRSENNLRYGLHFMFSDSCRYENNEFIRNGAGVAVMYTRHVEMVGNTFRDSWGGAAYGLLLKDIKQSRVEKNTFSGNSIGIHMEGSDNIVITRNQLLNNGWALRVMANCMGVQVVDNEFLGNSFQVATNSRQSTGTFSGNYWSTYHGYDLDRDGYGDVPFRPVSLYSLLVESNPPTLVLLRSLMIDVLNLAERVIPTLTPETLMDAKPRMRPLG